MTPLWVISLFVSLTEVIAGIAVTKASGGVQVALTTFVIAFPTLTAAGFFGILWHKPYVLYPPSEFGGTADVAKFVQAMQKAQLNPGAIHDAIRSSVADVATRDESMRTIAPATNAAGEQSVDAVVDAITERAVRRLESQSIVVDLDDILKNGTQLTIPISSYSTVYEFLDGLYFAISAYVPAYTFGERWALEDFATGAVLKDLGRNWALRHGMKEDQRSLASAGLLPGMRLRARYL